MSNYIIKLNKNKEEVRRIRELIAKNDGYCPCALEKNDDTKCMCAEFKNSDHEGYCRCTLYYKSLKEEVNNSAKTLEE